MSIFDQIYEILMLSMVVTCSLMFLFNQWPVYSHHLQQKKPGKFVIGGIPILPIPLNTCCLRIAFEIPKALAKNRGFFNFLKVRYVHGILLHHEHSFEVRGILHKKEQRFVFNKATTTIEWLGKRPPPWKIGNNYTFQLTDGERQLTLLAPSYEQACDFCQMLNSQFQPPAKTPHSATFLIYALLSLNVILLLSSAFVGLADYFYWILNTTQTHFYWLFAALMGLMALVGLQHRQVDLFPACVLAISLTLNLYLIS